MSDHPVKLETVERAASAHGWVRRRELDTASIDAWEKPDGQLYAARKGHSPVIVTLTTCFVDASAAKLLP